MMKEFNRYNLAKPYNLYKARYNILLVQIEILQFSIDEKHNYYLKQDIERTISETKQLDGYTECLFDLGIISENDFDKFWDFTQLIRLECNDLK